MRLFDCTLRDGGNVVGKGFDAELTEMILKGLIRSNVTTIEMGNCTGIGSYESDNSKAPCTDREYLELVQPYLGQATIGMFMGWKNGTQANVGLAKKYGLSFLRVGANAGDGASASDVIKRVKDAGMACYFSLMKAYILSAEELADEGATLAGCGLDEITIMDSAGTMTPDQVTEYVKAMKAKVKIPVAFHGHNNLGLSVANALAAQEAGAETIDCGLLGMARSAGNCATELAAAAFQKKGLLQDVDLMSLLEFEDRELIPAMEKHHYHTAVKPIDLILGLAGAHSGFTESFREVAARKGVSLYKLILEVSRTDRKNPDKLLMEKTADFLKQTQQIF